MRSRILLVLAIILVIPSFAFAQNFIQRQGKKLYYQGDEIYLRGMAFGNLVWDDTQQPQSHHTEKDLERIHNLGMNAIRFYLNYKTFEDDAQPYQYKQSGWDWIDQNIQWAKNHNVFLILNMHVPQGGFQSQCNGAALWTNPANQARLSALWKAIAARYKDEPQIAGFDLVNEPTPSGSVQNWSTLAQRIIDSIRTTDNNHLIITERAIALDCDYSYSDANNNYPQITETNLMYTVHMYDPYEFTHQNMTWAGTGDGGKYPDENKITPPSDAAYATGNYANPSVATGTTGWTYYVGTPYTIMHDSLIMGRIVFVSNKIGTGTIYFDDLVLEELDASGNVIRTVYQINLTAGNFWWWSSNGTGNYSASGTGHNDNYSITVTGNTSSASVICADLTFKTVKNRKYRISGWMRGDNIPTGSSASITTEFYHSPSHSKVRTRNYEFMKEKITTYSKYIEDQGFPVYFGEFGAGRPCFLNNKGGAQWVKDAMHIFDSLGYHFTYHSYKESSFGYYDGWAGPVDTTTVNAQLRNVFLSFFGLATGIEKKKESDPIKIQLYPNPAKNEIHIGLNELSDIDQIELLDLTGTVLMRSSGKVPDIENLPAGLYLIHIYSKDSMYSGKLIKE